MNYEKISFYFDAKLISLTELLYVRKKKENGLTPLQSTLKINN